MPRPRRFFPPEYMADVVELIRTTAKTVGQVARELDLTGTAVREGSSAPTWMQAVAATVSPPPSARSCAGCLVYRILQLAEDEGAIAGNPVRKAPAPKRRVDPKRVFADAKRRALTPEEAGRLLARFPLFW